MALEGAGLDREVFVRYCVSRLGCAPLRSGSSVPAMTGLEAL